jgi:hypothetical protein
MRPGALSLMQFQKMVPGFSDFPKRQMGARNPIFRPIADLKNRLPYFYGGTQRNKDILMKIIEFSGLNYLKTP